MAVDGRDYPVQSHGTLADIRPTPIFSDAGMEDGDHQFWGRVTSLPANALIVVDYVECVIALTPFCPINSVLTISPSLGLKIRLEGASIFSVLDQLRLMYPHRRSLWTILTRTLYSTTTLSGRFQEILGVTKEHGRGRRFPVLH
jgi:hypothetical protein